MSLVRKTNRSRESQARGRADRRAEWTSNLWFPQHFVRPQQGSKEVQGLLGHLWPAAVEYASPLNPGFLVAQASQGKLPDLPVFLARDGLIPLLWSFARFPEPPRKGGVERLLVAPEWVEWVPLAWRKRVRTYRVVRSPSLEQSPIRRVLFTGVIMDTYCTIDGLRALLDDVNSLLPKGGVRALEPFIFAPPRLSGYGNEHAHGYFFDFVQTLFESCGRRLQTLDWRRAHAVDDWSGTLVVDLSDRKLCADSYGVHFALSRGAIGLEDLRGSPHQVLPPSSVFVPHSPYYGVLMEEVSTKAPQQDMSIDLQFAAHQTRLHQELNSPAGTAFPWPGWFQAWIQNSGTVSVPKRGDGRRVSKSRQK